MTEQKLPDDFADNPLKARNLDDPNAINEGSLWGMERAHHAEKKQQNTELTLGAIVDWIGVENLPTAEELAEYQDESFEEKVSESQYSNEGRKIIMDSLVKQGQKVIEKAQAEKAQAEKAAEDSYITMWKKHQKETRGD